MKGREEHTAYALPLMQRRLLLPLTIGFVILLMFLLFGITSHADEKGAQLHKYYTSVLVIDEESLAEQVEEYAATGDYPNVRTYLREVCRINHLAMRDADTLKIAPGNYVILPYYSSEIL